MAQATLNEMRALLPDLPGPDLEAGTEAARQAAGLAQPPGGLGRLDGLVPWLATWQGKSPPSADHPRTAIFVGTHGVSPRPYEVALRRVENFVSGGAAVNQLCRVFDADLRVYELALEQPTADITHGPAMTEEETALAIAYGMMAVEPGTDLIALDAFGIDNDISAAALACALFGGSVGDFLAPARQGHVPALDAAIARHRNEVTDAFDWLRRLGGREMAACVGTILAARRARVPVLLDGFAATAAASVLFASDPRALDHCVAAHVAREPGHRRLLDFIGQQPLLDLGMVSGEGAGATLAISLLRAAISCHAGMASLADARLGKADF